LVVLTINLIFINQAWAENLKKITEKPLMNIVFDTIDYQQRSLKKILLIGLPKVDESTEIEYLFKNNILVNTVKTFMDIDISDPTSIVGEQMPLLALGVDQESPEDEEYDGPKEGEIILPQPLPPPIEQVEIKKVPKGATLVAVYSTHTGETFELTDGVARYNGKRGGITQVSKAIANRLQDKYGIKVFYTDKIHDRRYNRSYATSRQTVKDVLAKNPSVLLLLDVHRDAGLGNTKRAKDLTTTTVNGQNVAKIMFMIGTHHPNWGKNYAFMQRIIRKTKEMYPQLLRGEGFREKRGPYNQHLSPQAILVEVGGTKNSTEEAVRAGELLANVINEVLKDLQGIKK
jgi:stage II sporulation protein P